MNPQILDHFCLLRTAVLAKHAEAPAGAQIKAPFITGQQASAFHTTTQSIKWVCNVMQRYCAWLNPDTYKSVSIRHAPNGSLYLVCGRTPLIPDDLSEGGSDRSSQGSSRAYDLMNDFVEAKGRGRPKGKGKGRGNGYGQGKGQGKGYGKGYGYGKGQGKGYGYGKGQGQGKGTGYGKG